MSGLILYMHGGVNQLLTMCGYPSMFKQYNSIKLFLYIVYVNGWYKMSCKMYRKVECMTPVDYIRKPSKCYTPVACLFYMCQAHIFNIFTVFLSAGIFAPTHIRPVVCKPELGSLCESNLQY